MAEASAQKGAAGEDPSMEEILQSIRSIIAEDGDDAKTADKPKPNNPAGEVSGSDVLELTDSMAAEAPPPAAKVETAPPAAPVIETPAAPAAAASPDVLSQIEDALATPTAAPATVAAVQPQVSAAVAAVTAEALLSEQAAASSTSAIKKLQAAVEPPLPSAATTPSPVFQSGNTVEAMVAAMLKPMIKDWLDANLPKIVERIVTLEIRRLSK